MQSGLAVIFFTAHRYLEAWVEGRAGGKGRIFFFEELIFAFGHG